MQRLAALRQVRSRQIMTRIAVTTLRLAQTDDSGGRRCPIFYRTAQTLVDAGRAA